MTEVCSDVSEERAVVRAQLHLYCFPYKQVHASRYFGGDSGSTVQYPAAEVIVVSATADFSSWCSPCLHGTAGLSGIHFPALAGLEIWDSGRLRRDVVFPEFFAWWAKGLDVCIDSTILMLLKVFWTKGRYVMAVSLGCGGYRNHGFFRAKFVVTEDGLKWVQGS